MNIDFHSNRALAYFSGTPAELKQLEDTLTIWAGQFDLEPRPQGLPIFARSSDGKVVGVLSGALAALMPRLGLTSDQVSRIFPPVDWTRWPALHDWLWPHQRKAVDMALSCPFGRGILEIPTGGGKTRIAAALAIAGSLQDKTARRWLYAAPNRKLLDQTRKTLAEAPGATRVEWLLMTYEQLAKRLRDGEPGVVVAGAVFDECHRIGATGWSFGVSEVAANLRIGMSGTPLDRTDKKNPIVVGLCGPVIMRVTVPELQEAGRLAKGEVVPIVLEHNAGEVRVLDLDTVPSAGDLGGEITRGKANEDDS